MARQAEKMGQRSAARTFYSKVVKDYPGTSFAKRAKEKLKKLQK
ncbi:MAG: tetratricopeptide repeat protein [Planctomycetota bacterium]|jgi:TolA-binding protein